MRSRVGLHLGGSTVRVNLWWQRRGIGRHVALDPRPSIAVQSFLQCRGEAGSVAEAPLRLMSYSPDSPDSDFGQGQPAHRCLLPEEVGGRRLARSALRPLLQRLSSCGEALRTK